MATGPLDHERVENALQTFVDLDALPAADAAILLLQAIEGQLGRALTPDDLERVSARYEALAAAFRAFALRRREPRLVLVREPPP